MAIIFDPRFFNFVILFLYACNVGRWLAEGKYPETWYWLGAFIITASVTFGKH